MNHEKFPPLPVSHYDIDRDNVEFHKELWLDWYHELIFTDEADGKEYTMLLTIMVNGNKAWPYINFTEGKLELTPRINERLAALEGGVRSPMSEYNEINAGNIELEHFFTDDGSIPRYSRDDIQITTEDDGTMIVELDKTRFEYYSNGNKRMVCNSKPLQCDIMFKRSMPEIWWGNKPHEAVPVSRTMDFIGTEELCTAEGTLTYQGKKMKFTSGVGICEHVWIKNMDWLGWRWMDWTWFHTKEVSGLCSRFEMPESYHWEWGNFYLHKEEKQINATKVTYRDTELAWSPEHMRFIPIHQEMVAESNEGTLKLVLTGVKKPIKRTGSFMKDYYSEGRQGWAFTFWTIVYEITGEFEYNDGRVITLTPGRGMNEPQAVSPIT